MFHAHDYKTGSTPVGDRIVVLNDAGQPRFELTIEHGELLVRGVHGEFRNGVYFRESLTVKPLVSNAVTIDLTRSR
jgi:hypothetical protein